MKALRRLTVRAALPDELRKLEDIVGNLRWSWHPESLELLRSVDPHLWRQSGDDPVRMLAAVSADRLAQLAGDRKFRRQLDDVHDELTEYLNGPRWYQQQSLERRQVASSLPSHGQVASSLPSHGQVASSLPSHGQVASSLPSRVAYFSPEFGITEVLPQYSGGLGILAGDHLKAASDLGVPIIGVGLLYRAGYFRQSLSADGWQLEHYPPLDPQGLPVQALHDREGTLARVAIALPEGRTLHAQIWVAQLGRVPLLLLDSDIEDNDNAARQVTDRLYGGGAEHRLEQEILLGIGGVRAIRAYCEITGTSAPEVFHTNEGHAGFLGVERIRELMPQHSFDEALQAVRAGTVFTTHTPVPAGIDRFERDLVAAHVACLPDVPVERVLELGAEADPALFNMAHMGLRLAQRSNGVSQLHGRVSREMFAGLWPGFDPGEVPITSITNGVHAPTWMAREASAAIERVLGPDAFVPGTDWAPAESLGDGELWQLRRALRERLVAEIRRRLRASCLQRGMSEAEIGWTASAFDPDVLTIGFARRVPSYKRLTLMLRDPQRLRALLLDPQRPVQVVVAGKSHPADEGGKALIAQLVRFADDPEVRHRIAFLPDYDIGMARYLCSGSDVWLNNPLRPLEASGTSGMKAALNGVLNLSIRDGWWDEWYDGENGWAIPSADGVADPDRRDDLEANGLYELIESSVAAHFYDRDSNGVPVRWVQMVRHTLCSLGPKVLASRMVCDYVSELYAPAARSARLLGADGYARARELAQWRARVLAAWHAVAVLYVDSQLDGEAQLGSTLTLRAEVALGELSTDDVLVQAVYGTVDTDERLSDTTAVALKPVGSGGSTTWFEGHIPLERTGAFGYTVRVLPDSDALATPAELGVVASA